MTDYTTLSDEELFKAAGIKGNTYYSKLSDEELYKAAGVTPSAEEKTNKLSTTEKFAKGAISGTIGGFENVVSLLDKAGIGDKDKLQIARDIASGARGMFGVTPQEYKPAGDTAWDSNKPFLERAAEAPRAVVEAAAPMALASMAGPVAAGLTVGATQAAPTIDRRRAAEGLTPDQELSTEGKLRVAGDLAAQIGLGGLSSKLTFGASPVKAVGLEGVKGAAKQLGATAAVDAAIGAGGTIADKTILEGGSPTLSDIAVGGIAGGAGGLFGGAKRAGKEAIVSTRFRALGDLDPQSRGEVADRLKTFDNSFGATRKSLLDDVTEASKGLDGVTKKYINDAKIAFDEGQRVKPEWLDAVTQADPEAGRALRNLDTFGLMRNYDKESFSTDAAKINPLNNWQVRWGDITAAHLLGPKAALALAGLQGAGVAAAKGVDSLTGLSDPAKVITDKFAGSADPTKTIAEARAAAKAKAFQQNDFRRVADLDVARRELDRAKAEQKLIKDKIGLRKFADETAVAKEKTFWDEQKNHLNMVVNSQKVEDRRLAGESSDLSKRLREERYGLRVRENSEEPTANDDVLAKAAKKVADATAKVHEATSDADPNMYVIEHRGQKIRVPKSQITSSKTLFEQSFREKTDLRLNLLDEAKTLTDNPEAHKVLDQLATDWTNTTNDPRLARKTMKRVLKNSSIPDDVKQYLKDNWSRVEGTWATANRNEGND